MTPTPTATRVSDIAGWWCVVARQPHRRKSGPLYWQYFVPAHELRAAQDAGTLTTVQRRDPDATVLLAKRRPPSP